MKLVLTRSLMFSNLVGFISNSGMLFLYTRVVADFDFLTTLQSFNKLLSNANNPKKWITNYDHKSSSASLSKEEKELEYSCRLIETLVIEKRPRRHGEGIV